MSITRGELGRERLGEVLVRAGVLGESQLADALEVQARDGGKLGEVLVKELVLTEEQIAYALAEQKGLDYVDLTAVAIDRGAATLVPERMARLRSLVPIGFRDQAIVVAMSDPLDIEALDDIELRLNRPAIAVVAQPSQIEYVIDKFIAQTDAVEGITTADDAKAEEGESDYDPEVDDVPIVRLVQQLLRDGVRDGASDLHFEPGERHMRVRSRIDGVLHDVVDLPRSAIPGIVSRLKVMSGMDIAERRRPQDGRIALRVDNQTIDMRAVCLPTHFGESIILRVLNTEGQYHRLDDIGLAPGELASVRSLLRKPWGAVLVSGPTGSGKTTTLYSAMGCINDETRKIISVEDPVEYLLPGVTQVAVNPRVGLTFATGLRTLLRSDPDIVMVGEIRDPDTAEIAVRAALTGHLVLSSIHTNDAPSAITRLADMGVPAYIIASSVLGVVAQRLVRVLCSHCKAPDPVSPEHLMAAGFAAQEAATVTPYTAVGCSHCRQTGYKGRIGVFEVMCVDEGIEHLALRGAAADEIRAAAIASGMRPLRRDALDKVAAGITSLEEIERVVM